MKSDRNFEDTRSRPIQKTIQGFGTILWDELTWKELPSYSKYLELLDNIKFFKMLVRKC